MADERTIVVVGGGLAGAKAVEALREQGHAGRLVLRAKEDRLPYERPPLSKGYLQSADGLDDATVLPREWYGEHDVDLRTAVSANTIDVSKRQVVTSTGEAIAYDYLLLATGATPRRIDIPGADLEGGALPADGARQRPAA